LVFWIIIKNNYTVVGVITAADKPAGTWTKNKVLSSKEYALAHNKTIAAY
jgi:methionyl-tRNA formyltransferase